MKYLILLASLLFACQPSSPTIVGKWLNKTDKEWHFKHNGDFVWTQGEDTLLSDLKYSLSTNTITLKKKNAEFLTFHYVFLGNSSLILWNYKTHEFNSHIDEIGLFHQVGKKYDFSKHNSQSHFIVSDNFIGKMAIVYSEIEGSKDLIHLKQPLTYTNNKIDVEGFALENYQFQTISGKKLTPIYKPFNTEQLNMDSVYVFVKGFNQSNRNVYNKLFQQEIKGNLLDIQIDTLSNLLQL